LLADPKPKSAVSTGVGLAGLAGLLAWAALARAYGMVGPLAALSGRGGFSQSMPVVELR
jgi:hypothetical protein